MLHWLAKSCCHLTSPRSNPSLLQTWARYESYFQWVLFAVSLICSDVSVVLDPGPVFMLKAFMADLAEALKHGWNVSLPHSSSRRDVPLRVCECVCTHTGYRSVRPPRPSSTTFLFALFSPDEGRSVRPCCVENTFSKKKIWFWDGEPTHSPPAHSEQLTSPFKRTKVKQTPYSELLHRNIENSAVEINSLWIISIMSDTKQPHLSEKRLTCHNTQMSGARLEPKPHHQSCMLRFQCRRLCVSALGCIFESGGYCKLRSGIQPRLSLKSKIQKLQKDLLMDTGD